MLLPVETSLSARLLLNTGKACTDAPFRRVSAEIPHQYKSSRNHKTIRICIKAGDIILLEIGDLLLRKIGDCKLLK